MKQLLGEFKEWIVHCGEQAHAGENPAFDRDFLRENAKKVGVPWNVIYRTIDLHSLCYAHFLQRRLGPPEKNQRTDLKLGTILAYVGLPEEPSPHHALTGATMEGEAFSRLIHGKSLLTEFVQFPIPEYLTHGNP